MNSRDHPRRPRSGKRNRLPNHPYNLLQHCALVEYEPQVRTRKSFGALVEDLGRVLPGVERWLEIRKFKAFQSHPQQFLVFCSPDPEALSICGDRRSLRQAVLFASGSSRYWTDFKCRPVHRHEKQAGVAKLTAMDLPYLGADWVVERDRNAIVQYEQEYEQLTASYRLVQSREVSRRGRSRPEGATRQVEGHKDRLEERQRIELQVEGLMSRTDVNDPEEAGTSSVAAVVEEGPSKPRRVVDPITKEDRSDWVYYLVKRSRDAEEAEEVFLKDFIVEYGADRNWTFSQWITYLKDNKADLHRQASKVQKDVVAS